MLVTVGGLAVRGYYSHADAFLSKVSAGNDVASSALNSKQDKAHFDFKSAGIISDFKRCHWTRAQLNKAEPGIGDKHFKCEELKAYVEPAERLKAASRQGLVQNCEQAIKAALWDPGELCIRKSPIRRQRNQRCRCSFDLLGKRRLWRS